MRANGCSISKVYLKSINYKRIKYGNEEENKGMIDRCPDCGARKGYYHHLDCDVEQCPKCGRQFISCDCLNL